MPAFECPSCHKMTMYIGGYCSSCGYDVRYDEDIFSKDAQSEFFSDIIKNSPQDIETIVYNNYKDKISRGDKIIAITSQNTDVLDQIIAPGKYLPARTLFDNFIFGNYTTLVYEGEAYIEEYGVGGNDLYVKEKIALSFYPETVYCNASIPINKLASSISPNRNSTRDLIAKHFLQILQNNLNDPVNIIVSCSKKLPDGTSQNYYKILGSYKIDQVESLTNGSIVWRRDNDKIVTS